MMYAVGEDDGEGWIAVSAESETEARRAYCDEWYGAAEPVPGHIIAQRVPSWDALGRVPNGADWLKAGLSYRCSRECGGMAFLDDGGAILNGKPVCGYCLEQG